MCSTILEVKKALKYLLIFAALFFAKPSQAGDTLASVIRPRIGLGTGTFTYYGEIQNYQKKFAPIVNKFGGILYVNAPITKFFNFEFAANYGKVASNERTLTRNINFESRIRMATFYLYYNFYPLFSANRSRFHPFLGVGISSFEFLSKTDLYDQNGNMYHYWSDGSIMDMDENDPLASTMATELRRDYTYETDLREQNYDSLGKYREQALAFPITLGAEWHLSPRWDFRIAATYNFTFTDLIDNFSPAGTGIRKGDKNKDRLLYSYVSLSYDLQFSQEDEMNLDDDDDIPLFAEWDQSDWDQDGVIDALDECAGTPLEALVDENGCPLDGDGDGVPDYNDDELNTPTGSFVDEFGVEITEEQFDRHWKLFNDSTGYDHDFAEQRTVVRFGSDDATETSGYEVPKGKSYVIIIGKEQKDVMANELHKYLGYNDYQTQTIGDTVYYILGEYMDITTVVAVKDDLEDNGVQVDGIGKTNGTNGTISDVDTAVISKVEDINDANGTVAPLRNDGSYVFRVQIGAFKNKIDIDKTFPGVDVDQGMGQDGITRYYSGKFVTPDSGDPNMQYAEADAYKKEMKRKGYSSAYVVVYKDGERLSLKEAGINEEALPYNYDENHEIESFVEPRDSTPENPNIINGIDMSKVKYRVVLAEFEGDVPIETLNILTNIGGVKPVKSLDGSTTYYSQELESEADIENAILDYKTYGLDDMRGTVEYEGKYHTLEEFKAMLEGN